MKIRIWVFAIEGRDSEPLTCPSLFLNCISLFQSVAFLKMLGFRIWGVECRQSLKAGLLPSPKAMRSSHGMQVAHFGHADVPKRLTESLASPEEVLDASPHVRQFRQLIVPQVQPRYLKTRSHQKCVQAGYAWT